MKSPLFNTMWKILASASFGVVLSFLNINSVNADTTCTPVYGGGETCVETTEREFSLEKKVRFVNHNEFKSRITGAQEGDKVEFRITVKNEGNVDVDEVKINDDLPKYLKTDEDTSWTIKNFKAGAEEEITFKAKVVDSDKLPDSDTCVVNEASLKFENRNRASDTAVVCIEVPSTSTVKKLPVTGADFPLNPFSLSLGIIAVGIILSGFGIKKLSKP